MKFPCLLLVITMSMHRNDKLILTGIVIIAISGSFLLGNAIQPEFTGTKCILRLCDDYKCKNFPLHPGEDCRYLLNFCERNSIWFQYTAEYQECARNKIQCDMVNLNCTWMQYSNLTSYPTCECIMGEEPFY